MLKVVQEDSGSNDGTAVAAGGSLLDEIVCDGARQMLAAALQAEVAAYVEAFVDELDEDGRRLVVRNGYHADREVTTAAGAVPVRAPRVNDRRVDAVTGQRRRFASAILPAWARKSPRVAEVLPLLYLHGLSSSDFAPALEQFLGTSHGLSPATITRLTTQWQDEAKAFNQRSLSATDYVYCWVDGIHLKVRLEQDKVCLLVMIGVRADGTKELIALDDGHRESTESWADLLRSAKQRGMAAPVLAIGDGALGFWAAVREVFPETREQRCWFHKIANVLNCLPKSAQPGAKAALAEIWNAEDKEHAEKAAKAFVADYGPKWPKAAAKITDDLDVLLAFYDYPAEHWVHLRTTNPIESTFATVRLRQRVTKGPGSRAAGVAMAFKLIESQLRHGGEPSTRPSWLPWFEPAPGSRKHARRTLRGGRMNPAPTGSLHHVELWVPNIDRAAQHWGWLLTALGYQTLQDWPGGHSWRLGTTYIVVEQSTDLVSDVHERTRPGLNHLAFHAGTHHQVDRLTAAAADHGWTLLFTDKHPHAGGPDHYAAYLANTDGYEVELIADDS